MQYLLDTNVISELRRPSAHGAVTAWMQNQSVDNLAISVMTITELQQGILLTQRQNAERAQELELWLSEIEDNFQILPMNHTIAREWARMRSGKSHALFDDAMIAATAYIHGLVVVTRNVKDFRLFQVPIFNPFEAS